MIDAGRHELTVRVGSVVLGPEGIVGVNAIQDIDPSKTVMRVELAVNTPGLAQVDLRENVSLMATAEGTSEETPVFTGPVRRTYMTEGGNLLIESAPIVPLELATAGGAGGQGVTPQEMMQFLLEQVKVSYNIEGLPDTPPLHLYVAVFPLRGLASLPHNVDLLGVTLYCPAEDDLEEQYIQQAMERIMAEKNITMIIIAHHLSTIKSADQIIVLDKGQVIEYGSHGELMHEATWYADMVKMQAVG